MPAQVVRLSFKLGISHFHCVTCGASLIDDEGILTEELCDHVVAVIDWIDELILGPTVLPSIATTLEAVFDNCDENPIEGLSKALPETVIFFDLNEPSRGGGHEGESIAIALEIAGVASTKLDN